MRKYYVRFLCSYFQFCSILSGKQEKQGELELNGLSQVLSSVHDINMLRKILLQVSKGTDLGVNTVNFRLSAVMERKHNMKIKNV
jgi:hypothetical protein